jgi:DNA-binding transcriptional regulator YiaG
MNMLSNEEIRWVRKTLCLSAAEFAAAVHAISGKTVSANTVSRWETGERFPSRLNMMALNELKAKAEKLREWLRNEGLLHEEGPEIGHLQPA